MKKRKILQNTKKQIMQKESRIKIYKINKLKNQKGSTLLVLVVTIIILLILAGITIGILTGDNGIIQNAGKAKEETEIANEKEILEKATVQAMGNNKYGNIEESELQEQLDEETGEGKTEATDIGDEFEVLFTESNRYYTIDKNGNTEGAYTITKDKYPGDITVGTDGKVLAGTEEEPYEIWCIEDLVAFSNIVNGNGIKLENGKPIEVTAENRSSFEGKYVALKTNLNFKSKVSYQNSERTDFGNINGNIDDSNTLINEMTTGLGFSPIGISNYFGGTFDGENNKINNIYVETTGNAGLFGILNNGATIKNIEISGEIKSSGHTGGIVGEFGGQEGGMIYNCINNANIEGNNEVGGIIGYNTSNATIVECKNYGNIKITGGGMAYNGIGGIVGCSNVSSSIESCENYGKVGQDNSGIYTGGIVGVINTSMEIFNCTNYGEVISNSNTGGIAGLYRTGENVKVYNSRNYGNINGNGAGGIVGSCNLPSYNLTGSFYIENCYNIGKIQATSYTGGIIGNIGGYAYKEMNIYINNCYNIGSLSGSTVGGIVGTIKNNGGGQKAQYLYVNQVFYLNTIAQTSIGIGNVDNGEIEQINNVNTEEFVSTLNNYKNLNGQYPSEWKKWKIGEDGHPIFE